MDIILGKECRRWSREDKLAIVAETFAPGAVSLEIARRRQISSGQIHTWRKQLPRERVVVAPPTQFALLRLLATGKAAKLNGVDPQAWLADVLARIAEHPAHQLGELLAWNWRAKIACAA